VSSISASSALFQVVDRPPGPGRNHSESKQHG
jgi:hypothetical protein